jgi:hypothetical protein
MTAFNVVRFRVKPGREQHFVAAHRNFHRNFNGFRGGALVKTGEGTYCIIGEWTSMQKLAQARPQMIRILRTSAAGSGSPIRSLATWSSSWRRRSRRRKSRSPRAKPPSVKSVDNHQVNPPASLLIGRFDLSTDICPSD